jgi:uncharacterized protein (UPF0332 family)
MGKWPGTILIACRSNKSRGRPVVKSKDFHKAFELRQSTDYKIIKPISADKANQIWQKAVKFVQALKHYLNLEINNSK